MARSFVLLGLLGCILLTGCYGTLKDYSPKSEAESQVRQVLLGFEQAYNTRDMAALNACFHEKPIMVAEAGGVFSPGERLDGQVPQAFLSAMERVPKMGLGEPTIFMTLDSGEKAVLEVISTFGQEKLPTKFSMMKNGGKWVIKKILYY